MYFFDDNNMCVLVLLICGTAKIVNGDDQLARLGRTGLVSHCCSCVNISVCVCEQIHTSVQTFNNKFFNPQLCSLNTL